VIAYLRNESNLLLGWYYKLKKIAVGEEENFGLELSGEIFTDCFHGKKYIIKKTV
jgi:hypothetical protein